MTTMIEEVIHVRLDICRACPTPCDNPPVRDECGRCPVGHWGAIVPDCVPTATARSPGILGLAANFAAAAISEAGALVTARPAVPPNLAASRLATCRSCPSGLHYLDAGGHDRCRHRHCGCYLRVKTTWRSQSCPAGHW